MATIEELSCARTGHGIGPEVMATLKGYGPAVRMVLIVRYLYQP